MIKLKTFQKIKQFKHFVGSALLAAYGEAKLRSYHSLEYDRVLNGGDPSVDYLHAGSLWSLSERIRNHLDDYRIPLKKSDVPLAHVMMDIAVCAGPMLSLGALTVATNNVKQIVSSENLKGTSVRGRAKDFLYISLSNDQINEFSSLEKIANVMDYFNSASLDDMMKLVDPLAKNCLKFGADGLALYARVTSAENLQSLGLLSHDDRVALSTAAAESLLKQAPEEMWKEALSTAFGIVPPKTEIKDRLALKLIEGGRYKQERLAEVQANEQLEILHQLRKAARESCAGTQEKIVEQMGVLVDEMPKDKKLTQALWCTYDFDLALAANMAFEKLQQYALPTHPRMRQLRIREENKV